MTAHERLVERLMAGTLQAEDFSHAALCPACGALLAAAPESAESVSPKVLEAAHRELSAPARPWWVWALGLGLANVLVAALGAVYLGPTNWGVSTSPHWRFLLAAALLFGLATVGVLLSQGPNRRGLRLALLLAALAPAAVLLAADGHAAGPHLMDGSACFWTVVALSVLPLGLGAWLLAQSAPSPARALAVGLVSAGVGLFTLQLTCEDGSPAHLLAFHLLPWAALGAAAVLLRRLIPTRSYAP